MRPEIIFQNIINLLFVAAVLEVAIMAIFSLKFLKDAVGKQLDSARDLIILGVSVYLCLKQPALTIFRGTGFEVPRIFDMAMCALIITRLAAFVQSFFARMRIG